MITARPAHDRVSVQWIAIVAALLPLFAVHAAQVIAIAYDRVPACLTYVQGCISVSAAARYEPAIFLYRPLMFTAAVALGLTYWLSYHWLAEIGDRQRSARPLLYFGLTSAIFMAVYVGFLGEEEAWQRMLRRVGINVYLLFFFAAQVFLTTRTRQLARSGLLSLNPTITSGMRALCLGQAAIATLSALEGWTIPDNNQVDNILEWNYGLFMCLFILLIAYAWRDSGYQLATSLRPRRLRTPPPPGRAEPPVGD